jgi:carbamoyl-phosphate synthase large subunit
MAVSSSPKTILVIGPGPRRAVGQDQFAHAVVSACTAFAARGHQVVLLDNAPYLAMPADSRGIQRWVEPLTPEVIHEIDTRMAVDGIYADAGGSGAQWLALTASPKTSKIVRLGAGPRITAAALDRGQLFDQLEAAGLNTPRHAVADTVADVLEAAQEIDFPLQVSLVPRRSQQPADDDQSPADSSAFDAACLAMKPARPPVLLYNLSDLNEWAEQQLEIHSEKSLLLEKASLDLQRFEAIVLQDGAGHQVLAGLQAYLETTGVPAADAAWVQPPAAIPEALRDDLTRTSLTFCKGSDLNGLAALTFALDPVSGALVAVDLALGNSRNIAFAAVAGGYPLFEMAARMALGETLESLLPAPADKSAAETFKTMAVRLPVAPHPGLAGSDLKHDGVNQTLGDVVGIGADFPEAFYNALAACDLKAIDAPEEPLPEAEVSGAQRYHRIRAGLAAGFAGAEQVALTKRAALAPWVTTALTASSTETAPQGEEATLFMRAPLDSNPALFRWLRLRESVLDKGSSKKRHILVIAGRPNAIGHSRELDLAAFQSIAALQAADCEVTVLACDPLSAVLHNAEEVRLCVGGANRAAVEAIHRHRPLDGVLPHCAPGTFAALTADLRAAGIEVLGTSSRALTLLNSPLALHERLTALGIPHPRCTPVSDGETALQQAEAIGYPLLIRPLTPAGGEAALAGGHTALIMNPEALTAKFQNSADPHYLMEAFIEFAIEVTADALCDGADAAIPQVVEHIELAGIHPGDAAWVIPPYSTPLRHVDTICEYLRKIALEFQLKGFLSGRFALFNDTVYLLSVDLAFSRTAAMLSDACDLPIFTAATQAMLGASLDTIGLSTKHHGRFSIREAVFPVSTEAKLASRLGPVMQSTGEVIGRAESFGMAYYKAQEAAGDRLPTAGGVLITVTDADKPSIIEPARIYREMGFRLLATRGTARFLEDNGITTETVRKLGMGRPDLVDAVKTGQVDLVINTPSGHQGQMDDSYIRKAAIAYHIPYVSTPAGALAAAKGIAARRRQVARGVS